MRDRDVELAQLGIRKDALVASFQAKTARWGHVQSAGLGAEVLALVAYFSGALGLVALVMTTLLAGSAVGIAAVLHRRCESNFERGVRILDLAMERLKERGIH